jgi:hypothetical protein
MTQTPVSILYCPSRRAPALYGFDPAQLTSGAVAYNADGTGPVAKTDYAANGGDTKIAWGGGPEPVYAFAGTQFTSMTGTNGIVAQRSGVRLADVKDGASNTYLLGEKGMDPKQYETGLAPNDDQTAYSGDTEDTCAWTRTNLPPIRDTPDENYTVSRFGSAHVGVFVMAFADGSIRTISYGIPPETHRLLGNRADGKVVSLDD